MSVTRKKYIFRLVFRCMVLVACTAGVILKPEAFDILDGMNFFRRFSVLHLLWLIWIMDMVQQIIPVKNKLPLGSMKLFCQPLPAHSGENQSGGSQGIHCHHHQGGL